jgi:predicted alpha/beta superfamily hydrolase
MNAHRALSVVISCCLSVCGRADAEAAAAKSDEIRESTLATQRITDHGMLIQAPRRMAITGAPSDYEIRVALPKSYARSEKRYPVLWVMDGSLDFDMAVETSAVAGGTVPELIVVSIGVTPDNIEHFVSRREYDFTFTKTGVCNFDGLGADLVKRECHDYYNHVLAGARFGGAERFLEFIVDDVRSVIDQEYRTSGDNTLFGYSMGGGFCVYALLERSGAFERYICGSPGLIAGNNAIFEKEARYAATHGDLRAAVFLSAGEGEMLEGQVVSAVGVVSGMARMAEILGLRRYPSLKLHARIFPGNLHDPHGKSVALYWGLRTLWAEEQGTVASSSAN